jgi:hypothetical protein
MYQLWTAYVIQLFDVCTMAVRAPQLAYNHPRKACMRALQSEGKIILIYSYFDIRVSFHPYYNMTLEFTFLGLVLVLLIIVPTLTFEKAFIYSVYLLICSCCNHNSLAFDTRVGHCIL